MEKTLEKTNTSELLYQIINSEYKIIGNRLVKVGDAPKRDEVKSKKSTKIEDKKEIKVSPKEEVVDIKEPEMEEDALSTKEIIDRLVNLKIDIKAQTSLYKFPKGRVERKMPDKQSCNTVKNKANVKVENSSIKKSLKTNFWFDADLELNDLIKSYDRITAIINNKEKNIESCKSDIKSFIKLKINLVLQIQTSLLDNMKKLNSRIDYSFVLMNGLTFDNRTSILMLNELVAYYELISYAYDNCTLRNSINKRLFLSHNDYNEFENLSNILEKIDCEYTLLKGNVLKYLKQSKKEKACLFPTQYRKH